MKYLLVLWVKIMNKKLRYLMKISLEKKLKSKWFLVANVILCVLIVGILNIDSVIKFFGGDFNEETNIIVVDNVGYVYSEFESIYNNVSYMDELGDANIERSFENEEELKEDLSDNDILLIINKDVNNFISASVIVNSKVDALTYQFINASLNQIKTNVALNYYGIDSERLALIEAPIEINKISLDDSADNEENELLMGTIFPIVILPFFMLVIFLVQMIGAEINEEKSTKSMEIIISNVSPATHFTSKLLAGNAFVLLQGFLLFVYVLIGAVFRFVVNGGNFIGDTEMVRSITGSLSSLGIMEKLPTIIPLTLILMIITFVAYSLLAGILASITTNMEDFQQMQTPIVIISLVGYYLSMMAVMFDGSMFIRLVSYIPFISALLSPALLMLGQIGIFDMCISIVLSLIVIFILYKYGLRIYKVGILNYSSSGLWKKMFKAIKNK